uniref:Zgc:154006 n=1 Tax=Nothobranchius furzeri TaxID=105023 RepID=A0A8C6PE96_NOTFU
MFQPRYYDRPPVYSPPYSTTSHSFYLPRSVHSPQSQFAPYTHNLAPTSYYMEAQPQHFYRWFSPPGFVKGFQGATALMCFIMFACVASTLVWDMNGFGYGGYGVVDSGSVGGLASGYYGGSYGYGSSYMTPQSAKAALISMAAINFLVSLGFLVGSFSRSRSMRGCRFYLTVFICDIILAVLQGVIDIIFVIGVNPMSQSSQSMLYNPMLRMCHNIQGSPSLSGSVGAAFPGSFPMYHQYLYHYCYMDPEEAVALVLGLMVVLALSLSAYYAYKTRSKIWHHGKFNIFWDEPLARPEEGQDVQDWVSGIQKAPTVVVSDTAAPDLKADNSIVSYGNRSEGYYTSNSFFTDNSISHDADDPCQNTRAAVCSSSSYETDCTQKLPCLTKKDHKSVPAAQVVVESQYETGYTSGDTGNELYPAITTDEQRCKYKKDFDCDLSLYKSLCAEMDNISDQMRRLSRELHTLDEDSMKYQGVADEYNRLKEDKRVSGIRSRMISCNTINTKLSARSRRVASFSEVWGCCLCLK